MPMFKCQQCGSSELKLMLQPSFAGKVDIRTTETGDVEVEVNGKTFLADLMFANQFALCASCEAIRSWEYYYPHNESAPES